MSQTLVLDLSYRNVLDLILAGGANRGAAPSLVRDVITIPANTTQDVAFAPTTPGTVAFLIGRQTINADPYDSAVLVSVAVDGATIMDQVAATETIRIEGAFIPPTRNQIVYQISNNDPNNAVTLTIDVFGIFLDNVYAQQITGLWQRLYQEILQAAN